MPKHRTELILDSRQYEVVARLARAQKRSISEVMAQLIEMGLERARDSREHSCGALAELNALREELERSVGRYDGDLVKEVRAERERQLDAVLAGEPPP